MKLGLFLFIVSLCMSCGQKKQEEKQQKRKHEQAKVKLMTLDPGHFHAALVHKVMYPQVDSTIYLFAPKGAEVKDFLSKIESYNSREQNPSQWKIESKLGENYLGEMISQKPGNVMIVAGKNSKKIDYILEAVKAGLNVYADKPLVITPKGFKKLKLAFEIAEKNDVLIYDIMTERFESTTKIQKMLSRIPEVFGEIVNGTEENPAISKESVHHFFKYVSGQPLVRPAWFFDVDEEGEGIVDVTTHLVDLVQWEVFPDQVINTGDIEILSAKRWPTIMTLTEFQKVTGLAAFPDYLHKDIKDGKLYVYSNGEINYTIRGKHAKVSVVWNYQAPEATGDTHYSIMRGTRSNLIIRQGSDENYKATLYVESNLGSSYGEMLKEAVINKIGSQFRGVSAEKVNDTLWKINIPDKFKIGHEAHFAQVTENYLKYLLEGALPEWEKPNMISKYYTTIKAYEMSKNIQE
ncbi:oxidoreductase [Flavivirga sp. Y03]|uniref:Oxidoreductase n=2 Tax=Flavivirga algicola TaxID=2729136 RepID=A0ABX1S1J0_9FLAO|nr:oxidoreductase [Flavivirga algicola]